MPLRVIFFIFLLVICGLFLFGFLIQRSRKKPLSSILILLGLTGSGLVLAGLFLPCFPLFGSAFCKGSGDSPVIALTFDDGPNEPYTSQVLDILKKYNVPATFFLVGKNAEHYPDVVHRMIRDGFGVGNHTWDHQTLEFMSGDEIENKITKWEGSMPGIAGISPKLFRAPHGWKSPLLPSILKNHGYHLVGWTKGVWDTDSPGEEILYQRLTQHLTNGEIILLHDGQGVLSGADRSTLVAVLPRVIEQCRKLGFEFVSLPEMINSEKK